MRIRPIRFAWSPARSFETVFDVLTKFAPTLPTDFASDLASTLGRCFGSETPSTVLGRARLPSAIPPAMPAAAAPMAIAGTFALCATCLADPTTPCPLPLLSGRAGAGDRRATALRLAPSGRDFARLLEDFADVDFVRPFGDAGFFAALERLVVRDAPVPLRAVADLLPRVLALFGLLLPVVPLGFEAVVPERFFALGAFGSVSAICPLSEAVCGALPETAAADPLALHRIGAKA